MKIGSLTTTPNAAWKETELGDIQVLVTGLKTTAFRRKMDVLMARPELAKKLKAGGVKEAEARDAAFNQAIATEVLKGWRNITEDDGTTEIPYSPEYALQLITESLPFRDAVVTAATEVDRDRLLVEEDAEGNSSSTSTGG